MLQNPNNTCIFGIFGENPFYFEELPPPCVCPGSQASDDLYRNRLRSLLGVDSLVGEVADLITSHGKLDSTYCAHPGPTETNKPFQNKP